MNSRPTLGLPLHHHSRFLGSVSRLPCLALVYYWVRHFTDAVLEMNDCHLDHVKSLYDDDVGDEG